MIKKQSEYGNLWDAKKRISSPELQVEFIIAFCSQFDK